MNYSQIHARTQRPKMEINENQLVIAVYSPNISPKATWWPLTPGFQSDMRPSAACRPHPLSSSSPVSTFNLSNPIKEEEAPKIIQKPQHAKQNNDPWQLASREIQTLVSWVNFNQSHEIGVDKSKSQMEIKYELVHAAQCDSLHREK